MNEAKKLLREMAISPQQRFYHGTKVNFNSFDPSFTGKGNDQEGPGFYFTTDEKAARGYAWPRGVVLEVRLHMTKTVPLAGAITSKIQKQARQLMMAAPDLRDTLSDWGEDYNKAFETAFRLVIDRNSPKEVFEQIWYDFYRDSAADWLANMVKLGYQGLEIAQQGGPFAPASVHAVVFDPKCIEIVDRKVYNGEE